MKIAVMATGGVGGYFGARLAAGGEDVHFIARGRHLDAIRERGLRVESANGDLRVHPARATDKPGDVGAVDIVIFAVKLWDTEAAGALCKPLLGPDTAVVSFMNGVDSEDRLIPLLGRDHVMGGVAYIASTIAEPGVIKHTGSMARIAFGELDGKRSARGERFLAACVAAGIEAKLSDNIVRDLWGKFALLASFSGVTCLTRKPMGPIRAEPVTRELLVESVREVIALSAAKRVDLGADFLEKQKAVMANMPAEMKSSMLVDLERGNRLELNWLSGAVARMGDEAKVATPIHHFIQTALKLYEMGAR
ncbi:MAG TPA: 2-dehydropantoate 2-reductase [Alphaproteobacteria bacterium]